MQAGRADEDGVEGFVCPREEPGNLEREFERFELALIVSLKLGLRMPVSA